MAQQSRAAYKATKNSTYSTNGVGAIGGVNDRNVHENIADSHFNLTDDKYTGAGGLNSSVSTIAQLKAIVTVSLAFGPPGVVIVMRDTGSANALRVYELCNGTDVESLPNVVRPTDYDGSTNTKVWKIASITASSAAPSVVSDIRAVPTASGAATVGQFFVTRNAGGSYPFSKADFVYELISSSAAEKWPYLVAPNDYNASTNVVMWKCYSISNSIVDYVSVVAHGFSVGDVLDVNYAKVASATTVPFGIIVYVPDVNSFVLARGGIVYFQNAVNNAYTVGINYAQPSGSMSNVASSYPLIRIIEIASLGGSLGYGYSGVFINNALSLSTITNILDGDDGTATITLTDAATTSWDWKSKFNGEVKWLIPTSVTARTLTITNHIHAAHGSLKIQKTDAADVTLTFTTGGGSPATFVQTGVGSITTFVLSGPALSYFELDFSFDKGFLTMFLTNVPISLAKLIVVTTTSTITLDTSIAKEAIYVGSATIGGIKTWALSGASNVLKFTLIVNFTALSTQTFPSGFRMSDARWAALAFTPSDTGVHKFTAWFDGTNWNMDVIAPYV